MMIDYFFIRDVVTAFLNVLAVTVFFSPLIVVLFVEPVIIPLAFLSAFGLYLFLWSIRRVYRLWMGV